MIAEIYEEPLSPSASLGSPAVNENTGRDPASNETPGLPTQTKRDPLRSAA